MSNSKVERYLEIREISGEYFEKIRNFSVNKNIVKKSARMLGMLNYKNELKFNYENEANFLVDFSFFEKITDKKNATMHYLEHHKAENEYEQEMFDLFLNAYASLFIITGIDKENSTLKLLDYFTNEESEIVDMGLSVTGVVGLPIFFRKVQFQDIAFSSGMTYAFGRNINSADDFINDVEKALKAVKEKDESIRRFIAFKNLNKKYGIDAQF